MKGLHRSCLAIALLGAAGLFAAPAGAVTKLSAEQLDSVVAGMSSGHPESSSTSSGSNASSSSTSGNASSGSSSSGRSSSASHGSLVSSVANINGKAHSTLAAL